MHHLLAGSHRAPRAPRQREVKAHERPLENYDSRCRNPQERRGTAPRYKIDAPKKQREDLRVKELEQTSGDAETNEQLQEGLKELEK